MPQMSMLQGVKKFIQTPPQQKKPAPPSQPAPQPKPAPTPGPSTGGRAPITPGIPVDPGFPPGGNILMPSPEAPGPNPGTPGAAGGGPPIFGNQPEDLNPYALPSLVNPFLAPFLSRLTLQGLLGSLGPQPRKRLPGPTLNPYSG